MTNGTTNTDSDTKYRFVATVRRGYPPGTEFQRSKAKGGAIPTAGELTIEYGISAAGKSKPETDTVRLDMYGPGHITGIDERQVVRQDPEPATTDFPPNYFPTIEFAAADVPWLFSPVNADSRGRGFPWLTLVTVEKQEGVSIETDGEGPLPVLSIGDDAAPKDELPPLSEAWAWAHAQVVGDPRNREDRSGPLTDALDQEFAGESDITRSRLISPRNLRPNRSYIAAVVPTFDAGRKAGLGESPPGRASQGGHGSANGNGQTNGNGGDEQTQREMALAWDYSNLSDRGRIALPIYYHWEFATGKRGDFEFLARALEPRNLSGDEYDVGTRTIDGSDPGPDALQYADPTEGVTEMSGAIAAVGAGGLPAYDKEPTLRSLLNKPASIREVTGYDAVGPTLYGKWHVQRERLYADDSADTEWFYDLNLTPGYRVAASTGVGIVQDQQEKLMASAWEQVGELDEVNRLLRAGQLSRGATNAGTIHLRKERYPTGKLLQLTAPMHDRLLMPDGSETVGSHLEGSKLPRAALSPAFRRLTAPGGRLASRLADGVDPGALVEGLLSGRLRTPPTPAAPDGIGRGSSSIDEDRVCELAKELDEPTRGEDEIDAEGVLGEVVERLEDMDSLCRDILDSLDRIEEALESGVPPQRDPVKGWVDGVAGDWDSLGGHVDAFETPFERLTGLEMFLDLERVRDELDWATQQRLYGALDRSVRGAAAPRTRGDGLQPSDVAAARQRTFRVLTALQRIWRYIGSDGGSDRSYLIDAYCDRERPSAEQYDPDVDAATPVAFGEGIVERVDSRIDVDITKRPDPLDEILEYPEFPQPMYRDLKNESEDYLLPGVQDVPKDTLGVLRTNPRFIEAFMIGLNQQMASELLWNRYATDRRGSYFRQFWDPDVRVPRPPDEDLLKDIDPVHTWDDKGDVVTTITEDDERRVVTREVASPLGSNTTTGATEGENGNGGGPSEISTDVVLLVRGKLLERYPNTTIYAAAAAEDADGDRVPVWPNSKQGEETDQKFPTFRGELDPDITFLGFDLEPSAARTGGPHDEGWFFVIGEPPGEPKFGLDANQGDVGETPPGMRTNKPSSPNKVSRSAFESEGLEAGWSGLSWGHLPKSSGGSADGSDPVADITYVRVDETHRPGAENWHVEEDTYWTETDDSDYKFTGTDAAKWGENGAHMADITWQKPVRIAIHATDMLPPAESQP
jgi:hypothetical protein